MWVYYIKIVDLQYAAFIEHIMFYFIFWIKNEKFVLKTLIF